MKACDQRMPARRRAFAACILVVSALFSQDTSARDYPNRVIKIVVAFSAGSSADTMARLLAQNIEGKLGANVIVENRPGASGIIGTNFVSQADPDGYTLLLTVSATHSVNPWTFKNLTYDPVGGFTHIALLAQFPQVVITPGSLPVKSLSELVNYGKSATQSILYGFGSQSQRVGGATLARLGGFEATPVSYRSPAESALGIGKGEVQFGMEGVAVALPHLQSGLLRALAVSTAERSLLLPDVPTLSELGYRNYDVLLWMGLSGPSGLPSEVTNALWAAVAEAMVRRDVREKLLELGINVSLLDGTDYTHFVAEQSAAWRRRIEEAGIQPQ